MPVILTIKDLPSPKGQPILGHLKQFKADNKHQVLERWVEECGDLFKIHFAGKQFVVSAGHELNQQILKLRPEKFRRYYKLNEIMEEMDIVGVFNTEGDDWRRHRRPASEALNLRKVKNFYPNIQEKTKLLINKWQNTSNEIDIQTELMKFTVDITTEIAFGYQLNTLNDQSDSIQKDLELIFPMINERITAPIPIWRYFKRQEDKELDRALQNLERVIYEFIDRAKERLNHNLELRENPSNFLEALLVEKEKEESFTDKEIYGNIFTMLLAGEDTTSNSLSWSFYYLAQHPKLVNEIREEANIIFGDCNIPIHQKDLSKLKLASAVAQETLRLKPVTPNLYLQANEAIVLNDFKIPKGTNLMLQNKVAQTQEQHFTDANTFNPKRWMNRCPMQENHRPETIKTFGAGARFCPGKNLAMYEMITVISSVCKNFNFELAVHPKDVKEKFQFTMYAENLRLKFYPISLK